MGFEIDDLPEYPGAGPIPSTALLVARDSATGKDRRVPASRLPTGALNANSLRGADKRVEFLRPYMGMRPDASTRTGLALTSLCPGVKCIVRNPAPASTLEAGYSVPSKTYVVAIDPTGALVVMADAGTTTRTVRCKWVEDNTAEALLATREYFNPTRVRYGAGQEVKHVIEDELRLFEAATDLLNTDFDNDRIPAPTGTAADAGIWIEQSANAGAGNDAQNPYKTVGHITASAEDIAAGFDSSRDTLKPESLCLGSYCYVEFPPDGEPHDYRLVYDPNPDPDKPLKVYRDGSYTGVAATDAKWVPADASGATAIIANVTETQYGFAGGPLTIDFNDFANRLLSKFQNPGFTFFQRASTGSMNVQVGTPFVAGFKSFTWGTSYSQNVAANSIDIYDETAGIALATDTANDGVHSASTQAFVAVKGTTRNYSISGYDTEGDLFAAAISIVGFNNSYLGYTSKAGALTMDDIKALGNVQLQAGRARSVGGVTAGVGLYTVYAWDPANPTDDVAQVLQDGVDSIRGAFGPVQYVTGPNELNVTVTVAYIRSNATKAFTGSTLAFS